MTDERQGEQLWAALGALPRGSGVIVRHYSLDCPARRTLIARIRKIARARRLALVVAGSAQGANAARADGFHTRSPHIGPRALLRTAAVHSLTELRAAERIGADLIFLSPAFATESHPGTRPLSHMRFSRLVRETPIPVIALGGMNARRARALRRFGIYGWAGIGALTPKPCQEDR
ncbi:thiamine phosphate synthase [Parasphingopyxis lamellibrachiae]|uniref:Thiamine-phosphate pyrophosphorylase n=1 Tax=Parasphingopyxis lamellibrachiae TaxID=680125 RepID=A0A3D9FHM1_9SPHN|nr:thiamine phosphate synthase [Parasphingopyxis lamellibrachiae]RED17077.1 thiamine-phosphate pyrophosphorylase [Parasphingopyxis lamellibrachiae]